MPATHADDSEDLAQGGEDVIGKRRAVKHVTVCERTRE